MIRIELAKIPALRLLIPFMIGIFIADLYPFVILEKWLLLLLCLSTALLFYLNYYYKKLGGSTNRVSIGIIVSSWILIFGYYHTIQTISIHSKNHFSKIEGDFLIVLVDEQVQDKNGISRVKVIVKNVIDTTTIHHVNGSLLIAYKTEDHEKLNFGDKILIPLNYREISAPQNPNEFNYKRYLSYKNIYHQQFIQANEKKLVSTGNGNKFFAFTYALRIKCIESYKLNIKNQEHASLISAFILGYRSDLSNETKGVFANTGTMHLLAVSGLHVGILFILINMGLSFLDKTRKGRIIKAVIFVMLLGFYAMLTGLSPAVCRASLMLSLIVISRAFSRAANSYNSIAVAAIIMLLINPLSVFEVGFQLSFIAVTGIIFFQPKIYGVWIPSWGILDKIWVLASTAIAAQLSTTAISLYYFHQFPNYFLLANIPAVPLAGLILYSGLATLLLSPIPSIASLFGHLTSFLLGILQFILKTIHDLPGVITSDIWISNWQFLLLYLVLFSVTIAFLFKDKIALQFSIIYLIFFFLGISFNAYENWKRKEFLVAAINGKTAVTFIANKKAYLYLSDDITEQQISYSLKPTLSKYGIKQIIQLNNTDIYEDDILYKNKNIIQFMDKRFAIISNSNKPYANEKIEVDFLIISQNPRTSASNLQEQYVFKKLIIDNSNGNFLENKLESECTEKGISFYSTKQSKAFITLL